MINIIISYQESYYNNNSTNNSYDIAQDIVDCTLDDKNNRIVVGIKKLDDSKIEQFKTQVLNSNALIFENKNCEPQYGSRPYDDSKISNLNIDTSIIQQATSNNLTIRPGMEIISNKLGVYSVGFPVYRTITSGKEYGFVTSAHYLEVGDTFLDVNTAEKIGTVKLSAFGGKYDVSFVALESGVSCSNNISNTSYSLYPSNWEIDNPVYGKLVYLYGAVNYSSGKIVSTNYTYYNKETETSFSGMVAADYLSAKGDSGGVVASSYTDNYTKIQEGIHCGWRKLDNDSIIGTYYCSAANIVNLWYLVCY